jgi:hypothetical protein
MKISLIALLFVSCLTGCTSADDITPPPDIRPQEPNVVSLAPQNWYIYYSAEMPPNPSADAEGAWSFDFPSLASGGHVNYIQTPFNATTTLHTVSVTFKVESDAPQYELIDPTDILPATIHLFIEQYGDDLVSANGRWWAQPSNYKLGSGDNETITFVVPLTYNQWSNVDGQQDPQAFAAALANIGWVGLTCGGQYFWGHGVALSTGTAKFILMNLQVN